MKLNFGDTAKAAVLTVACAATWIPIYSMTVAAEREKHESEMTKVQTFIRECQNDGGKVVFRFACTLDNHSIDRSLKVGA